MSHGFLGGTQVKKIASGRNRGGMVYPRQQEDDNVKKWVEMIIVKYFFNAVATVDVLMTNSNDVTSCQNSICTFCMTMNSSYLFNRINKLDRNYSYHLFAPLKYNLT